MAPIAARRGRRTALVLAAALLTALLPGCQARPEPAQSTILAMHTVMSFTIYGEDGKAGQRALALASETIYGLEKQLSATDEASPVHALNHAGGEWVELEGEDTAALLAQALALCGETGGALDITAGPAVRAWGFLSGEYRVPDRRELEELAGRVGYTQVELENRRARLPAGMEVDLGAVAKGYAGDKLAARLAEAGVDSALLNLGQSSIQTMGRKPDGSPWRVGVQDPHGEDYLGVVELTGQAMGTSGGYQRYFQQDGQTYWHILDPETAAPARSGLASVTVVAPSGLACDGLSTALFVMGLEKGAEFWRARRDFEAIFIEEDGSIAVTAGLEESFSLAGGYEDREVTVLE